MTYTVVIPARYASSRLPGKPLEDIAGKPMIQRVWEQARKSSAGRVVVATDDERIAAVAREYGVEVCMTSSVHPSGTDRLQEVAAQLTLDEDHVLVNVQGDEPLIPPEVIDQVAAGLTGNTDAAMATLCEPITTVQDLLNPNIVKVAMDGAGRALYFSRAPIPWPREAFARDRDAMPEEGEWFRHIGIYAYRTGFLHDFVGWPPAPLEQLEQLEQLRAMYHGAHIHVSPAVADVPGGVDTPEDLERLRQLLGEGSA